MDLFDEPAQDTVLGTGAMLLAGFARGSDKALLAAIDAVIQFSPLRHMVTPGGRRMSVAMTNCGRLGWVTDRSGYRYDRLDPDTGRP